MPMVRGGGGYSKAFMLLTPPPLPMGILFSPQFCSQETKMAASQTHGSTTTILHKNRGLWTVLFFVQGSSTTVPQKKDMTFFWPKFIYNNLKFYHIFSHNLLDYQIQKEFWVLINKLKVVWNDRVHKKQVINAHCWLYIKRQSVITTFFGQLIH